MPRTAALCLALVVACLAAAAPVSAGTMSSAQVKALDAAGTAHARQVKADGKRVERTSLDEASFGCVIERLFREDISRFRTFLDTAPDSLGEVLSETGFVGEARVEAPGARRFARRLVRLDVDDDIVSAGIGAWTEAAEYVTKLARRPLVTCAALIRWIKSGYAERLKPKTGGLDDSLDEELYTMLREVGRAERRLLQLGVSSAGARGFASTPIFGSGSGSIVIFGGTTDDGRRR
jgi:hypothetical protein